MSRPMTKLRIGVLGLRRGLAHLSNLLTLREVDVVGACDRFPAKCQKAQSRIDQQGARTRIVSEYEALLKMDLDAVVIASNGKVQVEHACLAMEAGCHVLSEVPGAYTQEELIRLKETVERTEKTYMLAENACYNDFLRYWRKWVQEDRFGPISIAEGEYLHYLPQTLSLPDGERLSPSEAKAARCNGTRPIWRADQPPIQYLTHDLGPLLEVLDDRCTSVACMSAPWHCKEAPLRSDGQIALLKTQKGTLIKILVTLNSPRPSEHRYRLFGIRGGVEWFYYENHGRYFGPELVEEDGWMTVSIGKSAIDEDPSSGGHGGTDLKVVRHFVETLLAGRDSPIDVYRTIDYALPGIIAARSAENGGAPEPIPDFRARPFTRSPFWDTIDLPDEAPKRAPYQPLG